MAKVYSWKEQLEKGTKAEELFLLRCHLELTPAETRDYDFTTPDGLRVELKTDFYGELRTPNFFIERWSVMEQGKPGGPWQSLGKNVDLYIYLYADTGSYFVFSDLQALCTAVEKLNLPVIPVRNKGYCGGGYKVPRTALSELFKHYKGS
jgi:hypothetical protein